MTMHRPPMLIRIATLIWIVVALALASCQCEATAAPPRLVVSAIPDQDPEKLQRMYGSLADYLGKTLNVQVEYRPVTDYKAAVTAFKVGDLDLVWFGGLTGVQARLQLPQAKAIVQRDIDAKFTSVFIANNAAGIKSPSDLKGKTFTFASESSTSGRLMPQFFLEKEGIRVEDFKGRPGFSGSHDKTIELVSAGSFEAGVVNEQVWKKRLAEGRIDRSRVAAFWTTPPYCDYHWVLHPQTAARFGQDFERKLVAALTALSAKDPEQAKILELFGAEKFIETNSGNYAQIEEVGRKVGLILSDKR